MQYHIDTGLIIEKFKEKGECPLCAIQKKAEEQFITEFLNDAVMDESSRLKVAKYGFCEKHFEKLFLGKNKLSLALQVSSRLDQIDKIIKEPKTLGGVKKLCKKIEEEQKTCVICSLLEASMEKYYKTIAQMFTHEEEFIDILFETKGFCLHHYASLLKYSSFAGRNAKGFAQAITDIESRNLKILQGDLKYFCDKHDYRNANKPFGDSETALPRAKDRLYGKKD